MQLVDAATFLIQHTCIDTAHVRNGTPQHNSCHNAIQDLKLSAPKDGMNLFLGYQSRRGYLSKVPSVTEELVITEPADPWITN
jgi:hypothetical protein